MTAHAGLVQATPGNHTVDVSVSWPVDGVRSGSPRSRPPALGSLGALSAANLRLAGHLTGAPDHDTTLTALLLVLLLPLPAHASERVIDIFRPEFVDRFAEYAREVARVIASETGEPGFYCPVNEISFFAWIAGDVGAFYPFEHGRGDEDR